METGSQNKALLEFLLELVAGNWNAVPQLPDDAENATGYSTLRELALLLAGQLRNMVLHKAYVNPKRRFAFIQHGCFILDQDFRIRAMTKETETLTGQSVVSLLRSDFLRLLNAEGQKLFIAAASPLADQEKIVEADLTFLASEGSYVMQASCSIAPLLYTRGRIAVNVYSLQPVRDLGSISDALPPSPAASQKVYEYILSHRDGALPTTKELARRFGTNEYELKKDFRLRFGTSIYQCYMQERITRSQVLLTTTALTLAEIARECGFEEYSYFAKAYRKHFGITPGKAREESQK